MFEAWRSSGSQAQLELLTELSLFCLLGNAEKAQSYITI